MDIIHKLTEIFSHNRWAFIAPILASTLGVLPSCSQFDRKTTSSQTGELVDADGLQREYVSETKEILGRVDNAEAMMIQAQRELDTAERDLDFLNTGYERDIASIESEADALRGLVRGVFETVPALAGYSDIAGLVGLALGGGLFVDNRRKDKIIKSKKAESGEASS